tara:strand:- start:131 stop:1000 length:870 start_codon:yes stop_codon:yes gene_type:complete
MKTKILIPIYNDWQSVFKLLENIDLQLDGWDAEVSVLIINDASTEKKPNNSFVFKNLKSVQIINMKKNWGHARCIAAGLKYISEKEDFDHVIPMDGDGEDRPAELGAIISEASGYPNNVITANRIKRSDGFLFRFCYLIHKYLTFIFAGQSIKFGNFACLPKSVVAQMIKEPATWSSFSGSLSKIVTSRLSVESIRGSRYFGPSKMSFLGLIKHSLSIIAVFRTTVLIRAIIFLAVYLFFVLQHISVVTLIPVALVILMIISVFVLSGRENITELNNSLENIDNIENIK